jgi:tetratricopeptide (TPR) repeat protein
MTPFPRGLKAVAVGLAVASALPEAALAQVVPTNKAAHAIARGDSLMRAFRTDDAIAAYRAGLADAPDDPMLLWKTARALATLSAETPGNEGDEPLLAEAVSLARKAVDSAPQMARAHTSLSGSLGLYGRFLAHTHRVRKAREVVAIGHEVVAHARRAIELDPADFAPYVILGIYHRELSTVHPLVKVVAKAFIDDWPHTSLGESRAYLEKAVQLAPDDVTSRLQLARTLMAMGDENGARRELGRVIGLPAREALDLVEQREARELLSKLG